MGALTYIFGFVVNVGIATVVAGLASLVAALLPVKSRRFGLRLRRAAATFVVTWLGVMLFGCIEMFRTHHVEMSAVEAAKVIPGLVRSSGQVISAERVYEGDAAQTYLLVRVNGEDFDKFVQTSGLSPESYDAHTAEARGWTPPKWWPKTPCPMGLTYRRDPVGDPEFRHYTMNWCPTEGRLYVQNFDY